MEIEIRRSTKKAILSLLGISILFASLIAYVFYSHHYSAQHARTFFYYSLPVYLFFLVNETYKIYKRSPVVKINSEFIWWKVGQKNVAHEVKVYWRDVHHFEIHFVSTQNGVDIYVVNPEEYFEANKFSKSQRKYIMKRVGTPFTIFDDLLEMDAEELLGILKNYQKRLTI
jgi:hypothetical protein